MSGPLDGVRVIELGGLGPGPFGAMILADLGADVVRVDRPAKGPDPMVPLSRGKRRIEVDLKDAVALERLLDLVDRADILIETWRPGVAQRLGLGPTTLAARNPRLIHVQMTGWGQEGPLAARAGHDLNYIGLTGALAMIGERGGRPLPPSALLGDMAGGGMLLAIGAVSALHERATSGKGQVVDVAIVDGAALLTTMFRGMNDLGLWTDDRGDNILDGASFYGTYETSDGGYMAVAPLEPQFMAGLLEKLGIDVSDLPHHVDRRGWPQWKERLGAAFATRTRQEWTDIFVDSDACVTPVLTLSEAPDHPHHRARTSYLEVDGLRLPAPAPRFGRTPSSPPTSMVNHGTDVAAILDDWS